MTIDKIKSCFCSLLPSPQRLLEMATEHKNVKIRGTTLPQAIDKQMQAEAYRAASMPLNMLSDEQKALIRSMGARQNYP